MLLFKTYLLDNNEILHMSVMCAKILLWSVDNILNQSTRNFDRILNSIEILLVGQAPGPLLLIEGPNEFDGQFACSAASFFKVLLSPVHVCVEFLVVLFVFFISFLFIMGCFMGINPTAIYRTIENLNFMWIKLPSSCLLIRTRVDDWRLSYCFKPLPEPNPTWQT